MNFSDEMKKVVEKSEMLWYNNKSCELVTVGGNDFGNFKDDFNRYFYID